MTALPAHLEKYLGPMDGGWSVDATGREMPFQVARFPEAGDSDTVAFATLGLNRFPLKSARTGRTLHQELLLLLPGSLVNGPAPAVLQQVAVERLETGRAILRGDVVRRSGSLFGSPDVSPLLLTSSVSASRLLDRSRGRAECRHGLAAAHRGQ
jgi:hypothetical protein